MHANQKTVPAATRDDTVTHHPIVATLLALVDDLAYRIRSLDPDYDECLVYQRAIAMPSHARRAARLDAAHAHTALRDLLLQLESVGIYLPGNDAGQWASVEGLSFSAAEAALTASGLFDKNDDSHWTMEADSTSIPGETSWSVMSGDNAIADFYGPKARDHALLLVTTRYEAGLPRRQPQPASATPCMVASPSGSTP